MSETLPALSGGEPDPRPIKAAFFDPDTGCAVRIYAGHRLNEAAVLNDPRYAHCEVRDLAGTPFETVMTVTALPDLAAFDAQIAP